MRILIVLVAFANCTWIFANPTCIEPQNIHSTSVVCTGMDEYIYVISTSYEYQCGNGETKNYPTPIVSGTACPTQAEVNANIPRIAQDIRAKAVNDYSGSTPVDGFEYWNNPSNQTDAKWYGEYYRPDFFSVQEIYPTVGPAFPFDGQKDDQATIDFEKQSAYKNKCRAVLTVKGGRSVRYWGDYTATVYVFPGKGDTDLFNKPLVVGDAFDPSNGRDAWMIYTKPQYHNLLSLGTDPNVDPINTFNTPRAQGYDIWFIDFSQGGGDIYINARLELRVIEWLKAKGAGRVIVGGPSMSGIVARTALLYTLPQNNLSTIGLAGSDLSSNIKGFLSIDSPHQGASISSDLQEVVYSAAKDQDINTVIDMANFGGLAQNNSAGGSFAELSVPAAHQMLYAHYYPDLAAGQQFTTSTHDAFYSSLAGMGNLRKDIPSVAIAYSNFYVPCKGSIDPEVVSTIGTMRVKAPGGVTLFTKSFHAGGGTGGKYEFYPGSSGNWYAQLWKRDWAKYMDMQTCYNQSAGANEVITGTFIPISSALGLDQNLDVFSNPSEAVVQSKSMFDKVYYLNRPKNDYGTYNASASSVSTYLNDSRRFEHIVFDPEVMDLVADGLKYIEKRDLAKRSMPAILGLLLH